MTEAPSAASTALPHPVLVADIGGTNCRVAVVDAPGAPPRPVARLATTDPELPTAEAALARALAACGARPRSAVLAVAGPVAGRRAELTNAGWSFDGAAFAKALGLDQGLLVNDFEALACALPELAASDLAPIGEAAAGDDGARLVLGPGTGFGAAALIGPAGRRSILASEAGHMELGPASPDEFKFWPHLARVEGRITIEALLSGPGLARLHAGLCVQAGRAEQTLADGARVQAAAEAGDGLALQAVLLFGRLLARVAGDLALGVKATGGVFIAGGVAQKLLPFWDRVALRHHFADKPPMRALLADAPLALVTATDAAERGLAAIARDPGAFGLAGRLWR